MLDITVRSAVDTNASPVARLPEASTAVAASGGITLALPVRWADLAIKEPTAPLMARSQILVGTRLACANLNFFFYSIKKMTYHLYKSTNKNKKYMIQFINQISKKSKTIHFGAAGYTDFLLSKDTKKKESYNSRHRHDNINNPNYAGFYASNLLWNKPSLSASIADTNRRYHIKIINHT